MSEVKRGIPPSHPGALLREVVIPALGISKKQVAEDLQISRNHLYSVLRGDAPISPDLAVKLGKYCGNGPTLWINMQSRYDIWESGRRLRATLREIPTREAAGAA